MNYLSICSGIEAASMAWGHLGFKALGFSEIEPFPSAVLNYHHPDVPNLGDMTKHKEWTLHERLDLLVGGTPCQAFSVAGSRRSLDDERGNLTLTFCNIADQFNPRFTLWENVPGVLNTKDNAFGCLLSGLAGLDEPLETLKGKWPGNGLVVGGRRRVAWVTLDAQYFGVPQRRRRIFVLAVDAQSVTDSPALCPSKILSIGTSLRRDTPPRRKTGQTAPTIPARSTAGGGLGTDFDCDGGLVTSWPAEIRSDGVWPADVAHTLNAHFGEKQGLEDQHINGGASLFVPCNHETQIVAYSMITANTGANGLGLGVEINPTLDRAQPNAVAYPLNTQVDQMNFDPFTTASLTRSQNAGVAFTPDTARSLTARHDSSYCADRGMDVVAFEPGIAQREGNPARFSKELCPTLRSGMGDNQTAVAAKMQVRRLSPEECEILQGFPVGFTDIKLKGKPTPDGPRYKALGNSMAVPVMRWIGSRIQEAL